MNEVVILFGGSSPERRVSQASAQNVASMLPSAELWFLSQAGAMHRVAPADLQAFPRPFENDFLPRGESFGTLAQALDGGEGKVFFLALHGGEGEDGTVQRMLEARQLAFTGPGKDASAKAFDKEMAKSIASAAGVRTVESLVLSRTAPRRAMAEMLALHGRMVVKPVAGGSSVGLHHVANEAELESAASAITGAVEAYLAEAFVEGIELTVGVVDEETGPRALPVSEIRVQPGRAFDYEGKYLGKGTIEVTPAEVPPEVSQAAQKLALTAHRALGCEGYSRTDCIVGKDGPVFLELNTLPGLTRASFLPQQLAAEGTPMLKFLEGQLALARRRRDREARQS